MNSPQRFRTALARDMFSMATATLLDQEREYESAMQGLPETRPYSDAELRRLADANAERITEGQRLQSRFNRNE